MHAVASNPAARTWAKEVTYESLAWCGMQNQGWALIVFARRIITSSGAPLSVFQNCTCQGSGALFSFWKRGCRPATHPALLRRRLQAHMHGNANLVGRECSLGPR